MSSHLLLPSKSDWMTMEERADNLMDQRVRTLLGLLDDHVLEKEFFQAMDNFYEEARAISIRGKRDLFEKVVLQVIEAFIREKFKQHGYSKYQAWRFELHRKMGRFLEERELPHAFRDFLITKKNRRVEGLLDLYCKKQSKEWYNPYLSYVGLRNEEYFEIKILFKNFSMELMNKSEVQLSGALVEWKKIFDHLTMARKEYLKFEVNGIGYVMASHKSLRLVGESVEIGLWS